MEDLKQKCGEKLEAIQVAAGNGKSRVKGAFNQTSETVQKVHGAFLDIWNHELILQSRAAISAWACEAVRRVKEGAPPLSPVVLYEELHALFQDRVWRRTMLVFACGVLIGGCVGLGAGLRAASPVPRGPHARALHTQPDQTVLLVDDHCTPCCTRGEVVVRVQAFSVTPLDRRVLRGRGGALRGWAGRAGPVAVGRAWAGVVLDAGPGVPDLDLGDEVWGTQAEWASGAASELLVVRSTLVSRRPRALAADGAAALVWGGALALRGVEILGYNEDNCRGKRVAVTGASSGAGVAALQLLSSWGAVPTAVSNRHAAKRLRDLGGYEHVECTDSSSPFVALETQVSRTGPYDAVLVLGDHPHPLPHPYTLLKATAPRRALVDLRPHTLLTDWLPGPLQLLAAVAFYSYRICRWMFLLGSHTDWLEERHRLRPALASLAALVDAGRLTAVVDKVYQPLEFEIALAHACSEEALGTTVIRFP